MVRLKSPVLAMAGDRAFRCAVRLCLDAEKRYHTAEFPNLGTEAEANPARRCKSQSLPQCDRLFHYLRRSLGLALCAGLRPRQWRARGHSL